jgi:hypothetical protein
MQLRACGGAVVALFLALSAGCAGPAYPNCATDSTCKPKGEFCVDNKCAQCRTSANCAGRVH